VRAVALTLLLVYAPLIAGCGGSAPVRDPAQEARVVAEINTFCRHMSALPSALRHSEQQSRTIQARSAALVRALSATAAYLPAGTDLNNARTARRALERQGPGAATAGRAEFDMRFRRLQRRIYDDELALGVTCAGKVAHAAQRTAHLTVTSAP